MPPNIKSRTLPGIKACYGEEMLKNPCCDFTNFVHQPRYLPTKWPPRANSPVMIILYFILANGWELVPPAPALAQEKPSPPASSARPDDSPPPIPPAIPPEILRQIDQFQRSAPPVTGPFTLLSTVHRILLFTGAGAVLFAALLFCRFLSVKTSLFPNRDGIFLLFGLFGAIVALMTAAALTATLYLHLAAAVCVVVSGFTITAFLVPQFNLTRRWVLGNPPEQKATGRNNDAHSY
jgi:hypothetical protein